MSNKYISPSEISDEEILADENSILLLREAIEHPSFTYDETGVTGVFDGNILFANLHREHEQREPTYLEFQIMPEGVIYISTGEYDLDPFFLYGEVDATLDIKNIRLLNKFLGDFINKYDEIIK